MLGLFEGVCSGAADGYGRMKEKPALCLLHLGPGLANGVANLHNAKRARTPLLNVIGEHASWHLAANAPLAMDIECLCKTFSGWQRTTRSVETIARDTAEAIEAALRGQIASLIVPCDLQWKEYRGDIPAVKSPACERPDRRVIESAAKMLKSAEKTALIMNGRALRRRGLEAAASHPGCRGLRSLLHQLPGLRRPGHRDLFPSPACRTSRSLRRPCSRPTRPWCWRERMSPSTSSATRANGATPLPRTFPGCASKATSRMRPRPWRHWPMSWARPARTRSGQVRCGV